MQKIDSLLLGWFLAFIFVFLAAVPLQKRALAFCKWTDLNGFNQIVDQYYLRIIWNFYPLFWPLRSGDHSFWCRKMAHSNHRRAIEPLGSQLLVKWYSGWIEMVRWMWNAKGFLAGPVLIKVQDEQWWSLPVRQVRGMDLMGPALRI